MVNNFSLSATQTIILSKCIFLQNESDNIKRLSIINVLKNDNSSKNVTAKIHMKNTYTILK